MGDATSPPNDDFDFVLSGMKAAPHMLSAGELFHNGQIKPLLFLERAEPTLSCLLAAEAGCFDFRRSIEHRVSDVQGILEESLTGGAVENCAGIDVRRLRRTRSLSQGDGDDAQRKQPKESVNASKECRYKSAKSLFGSDMKKSQIRKNCYGCAYVCCMPKETPNKRKEHQSSAPKSAHEILTVGRRQDREHIRRRKAALACKQSLFACLRLTSRRRNRAVRQCK